MKNSILVRAIITGFGLRIGAELGKFVAARLFPKEDNDDGDDGDDDENEGNDDSLGSITPDPPVI